MANMTPIKSVIPSLGRQIVIGMLFLGAMAQCTPESQTANERALFELMPADSTGIAFQNTIKESAIANIMTFQYFYNGGGVAAGDLNQDGLIDLYFTGNMVGNKLYLNKGNLKFRDATLATNTAGRENGWATGVALIDINQDGLLDIYVCYSGDYPDAQRRNQLFVNQGNDSKGIPEFKELAKEYGLDDPGYSTSVVFFDFDIDGDLDMLLVQHNPKLFSNLDVNQYRKLLGEKSLDFHTKLYENTNGNYRDVTELAGLSLSPLSYGLGAGVSDFNGDGLPDIFVGNDYSAPDYLYINQGDGTFVDHAKQALGHTSLYTMGLDIADINNDGLVDILTLDMLPEDSKRQKLLFSPENYDHFDLIEGVGLHKQYMRNMLHLNNGNGVFSEIGQLAGISNTDWSWAPLFADFDNDGHKDLLVTNGFLKDFTNLDFVNYRNDYLQNTAVTQEGILDLINRMPATPLRNYIFKNLGESRFADKSVDWGLRHLANSNGAVYADLDNDGDLDLIINNINGPAFVYQNTLSRQNGHIQIELKGDTGNLLGYGAQVRVYGAGKSQLIEQQPFRGYQGSVSPILQVGLGDMKAVDSVVVRWPDGLSQQVVAPSINTKILIKKAPDLANGAYTHLEQSHWQLASGHALPFHRSPFFRDFNRQGQLMEALSPNGPLLKTADIDGDGIPELVGSGLDGHGLSVIFADNLSSLVPLASDAIPNGAIVKDFLFFDIDNDGDQDLFIVVGGYHDLDPHDPRMEDLLLLNDGKGNFQANSSDVFRALPHSGSAVSALDINADGFLDLVVGGFYLPARFPESDPGQLWLNQSGYGFQKAAFSDSALLERTRRMETADLDGDGKDELIVAAEWAPLRIFCTEGDKMKDCTDRFLDDPESGLWKSLLVEDLDGDGIPEILVGNHGLNSQYRASLDKPMTMRYADFDQNGSIDPILEMYIQERPEVYLSRDELGRQLYRKRALFPSYGEYATAGLEAILNTSELAKARILEVNTLETTLYKFQQGKFKKVNLPTEAQFAPVYAILAIGNKDQVRKNLLLAGNQLQARMKIGSISANQGVLLNYGDDLGTFKYLPQHTSGFKFQGDVRSLVLWQDRLWVGSNNLPIVTYEKNKAR